jgi:hypothetical protein
MSAARLKHFGWGARASQKRPPGGACGSAFRHGAEESASAPRLEDIRLEAPRVMAPASLPFCTAELYQADSGGQPWLPAARWAH